MPIEFKQFHNSIIHSLFYKHEFQIKSLHINIKILQNPLHKFEKKNGIISPNSIRIRFLQPLLFAKEFDSNEINWRRRAKTKSLILLEDMSYPTPWDLDLDLRLNRHHGLNPNCYLSKTTLKKPLSSSHTIPSNLHHECKVWKLRLKRENTIVKKKG